MHACLFFLDHLVHILENLNGAFLFFVVWLNCLKIKPLQEGTAKIAFGPVFGMTRNT